MTTSKHLAAGVVCFGIVVVLIGRAQNPPAPAVDRVGFPGDYKNTMNLLYVFDRPDNKTIRTVYANDVAFNVQRGGQGSYPYGSVLVFESWPTVLQDAQGNPILDANGRFQKDPTAT